MKRFVSVVSAVSLAAALTVGSVAASLGDVNGDGKLNSTDALCILQYSVGKSVKGFIKENADLNSDGKINSADALKALRISVGLETLDKMPENIQDSVTYYNNALKKSYKYAKTGKTVISDLGSRTVNGKVEKYSYGPDTVNGEFVNGFDKNGLSPSAYGAGTSLTAAMLKSAVTTKSGDGFKIVLTLKSEKVDAKKHPIYNSAGAFPLEMSGDGTPLENYSSGTVNYPGTVIEAYTDSMGRVKSAAVKMYYETELYMKNEKTTEKGTYNFSFSFTF